MSVLTITDQEIKTLNFGENFAMATRTAFTDNGLDAVFSTPQDQMQAGQLSGEIVFALGGEIDTTQDPNTASLVYGSYTGTLNIKLRCQRGSNGPGFTSGVLTMLNNYAAKILAIMALRYTPNTNATFRSPYDLDNLPYYSVKYIKPLSVIPYTDYDFLQDVMDMSWEITFSIIPDDLS